MNTENFIQLTCLEDNSISDVNIRADLVGKFLALKSRRGKR